MAVSTTLLRLFVRALLGGMWFAWALCLTWAQQRQPPDFSSGVSSRAQAAGKPFASFLQGVRVGEPLADRQRVVVPLTLAEADPLPQTWLTASQALQQGYLQVREGEGVPRLYVYNRSSKYPIFIPAGQVFDGGKQNRSLADELVLAPRQRWTIPVFCVEQGRWSGIGSFHGGQYLAPPSLRATILSGRGQGAVWRHVAWLQQELAVSSRSQNLLHTYQHARIRGTINSFRHEVGSRLPEQTVGVVLFHNRHLVAVEVFGSPKLAREMLPAVLEAFCVDSLAKEAQVTRRRQQAGGSPQLVPLSPKTTPKQQAKKWLAQLAQAPWKRSHRSGAGHVWRVDAPRFVGRGLIYQGRIVHLVLLQTDRTEPPAEVRFPRR